MSALTDLLHTVITMLPFHSEPQQDEVRGLIATVEDDVKKLVSDAVGDFTDNVNKEITELKEDLAALKDQANHQPATPVTVSTPVNTPPADTTPAA